MALGPGPSRGILQRAHITTPAPHLPEVSPGPSTADQHQGGDDDERVTPAGPSKVYDLVLDCLDFLDSPSDPCLEHEVCPVQGSRQPDGHHTFLFEISSEIPW